MWRLLLLFSILPIAAALLLRWWFGMKVLAETGGLACRCDPEKWPGETKSEGTAAEFGRLLRLQALAQWMERDPKAAKSRESSRRFGMAVPPLSGVVAVLAVVVAKIPIMGAIAVILAATALSAVLGLLSLAPELMAVTTASKKLRDGRAFSRRDDEEAVIQCAIAHAWKETLPPVLGLFQR